MEKPPGEIGEIQARQNQSRRPKITRPRGEGKPPKSVKLFPTPPSSAADVSQAQPRTAWRRTTGEQRGREVWVVKGFDTSTDAKRSREITRTDPKILMK